MMKKKLLISIILIGLMLGVSIPVSADTTAIEPNVTWVQTYGRLLNDEWGSSVQQTSDGGYIVVGAKSTAFFDIHSKRDVWLVKLDDNGLMQWEKTFGTRGNDMGNAVLQTSDNGFIITGSAEPIGTEKGNLWIIKTDDQGNKQWDSILGVSSDFESGSMIIETDDSNYIVVGSVNTSGGGRGDIWLLKIDAFGNKLWDKSFGDRGHNYADDVVETSDGFVILGSSWIPDETNGYDIWLLKTDKKGELLWDQIFDASDSDHGWSLDQCDDGGFIITGEKDHGSDDKVWLIKTDENGNLAWDTSFPGRGDSVQQTSDGGFIIAGYEIDPTPKDYSNGLLIKTDGTGNLLWKKTLGGKENDFLYSIEQTADNGFIVVGGIYQTWFDAGLWIMKLDPDTSALKTKETSTDNAWKIISLTGDCSGHGFGGFFNHFFGFWFTPHTLNFQMDETCELRINGEQVPIDYSPIIEVHGFFGKAIWPYSWTIRTLQENYPPFEISVFGVTRYIDIS